MVSDRARASAPKKGNGESIGVVVAFLMMIGLLVGIVWLAIAMVPGHVPTSSNPSSVYLITANRWVIWLARLAGLVLLVIFGSFAVYAIGSIRHRIHHGHWLRSGGPFEAEIIKKQRLRSPCRRPLRHTRPKSEDRNRHSAINSPSRAR